MSCDFRSADPAGRGWQARLDGLVAAWSAGTLADVADVLARADAEARAGRWVAVAVSYDAAPAFEPALQPSSGRQDTDIPLAWAAAFEHAVTDGGPAVPAHETATPSTWPVFEPSIDVEQFEARVARVQEAIRDGESYQINLTFPLHAQAPADIGAWFDALVAAQRAGYCARLNIDRHTVLSLSPELFFERRGTRVRTRPMKGTSPRGRFLAEDEARAEALAASEKAQAENVMIVDLLRNDLGRVAVPGSVQVPSLYTVERYPTLWQLTSTVEAEIPPATTLADLFGALFPCGSVTGAPKIRTMALIDAIEQRPRGLYTGAIGLVEPGGDCTFSVAIRTIVIERESGQATMGVGAGITADSIAADEYEECLLKSDFAAVGHRHAPSAPFALLETMRLEDGDIPRLDRHLARMAASARYFGYTFDDASIGAAIDAARQANPTGRWRLRLTVDRTGTPEVTCAAQAAPGGTEWRVAFAPRPVDGTDPFLCNKTTHRAAYDAARRARPDVDDVLLWNQAGEVTESTIANIVAEIDGERWTPPVACGLLAGTFRGELLEQGAIRERVLTRGALSRASRLWLVNSLRGWIEAMLIR